MANEDSGTGRAWPQPPPINLRDQEQGAFRETFLAYIANPEEREAFRTYGIVQFSTVLSSDQMWRSEDEDSTTLELKAILADLRYLQKHADDFACMDGVMDDEEALRSGYSEKDISSWRRAREFALRLSARIQEVAEEFEREVKEGKLEP